MAVLPLVVCSLIALGSAVFCFDARGVLTRYATWRFNRLKRLGLKPSPDTEAAYVSGTRRYVSWTGYVLAPLAVLGVIAAVLAR